MNIPNKSTSFELYKKGKFGNKVRTWYSIDEFKKENYSGSVTIRYKGAVGGLYLAYDVKDVDKKINEFVSQGAKKNLFVINESGPDDEVLIQGEIMRNTSGYSLFYSLEKGKMRDCLKKGEQIEGLNAKLLMQKYLTPNSLEDIMELLDEYPGHIVEFSTYDKNLGDCSARNTVIWEVRNY